MSKRILQHPETPADETTIAWRSVGQLENTPDFREWLEREFPRGAAEMADEADAETSRRSFLKLMGASTALAGFGMAACRRPESFILPYAKAPEWVIPGKATYYASSFPSVGGATPLVVTSFEGRPTKLAPNTLHPDSAGTSSFAQASILDLYSPYRSRTVMKGGKPATRADLEGPLAALAADPGAKLGIVFGRDDSPTRSRLVKELAAKFANARFYAYEALEGEAAAVAGDGQRFVADFSKADCIVSLDSDFVGLDPVGPVTPFHDRRKPEGRAYDRPADVAAMNRLYSLESSYSLTGGMADHRLRLKPSEILQAAAQLATKLGASSAASAVSPLADANAVEWIDKMGDDLATFAGRSLVVAGSRQPAAVHHLTAAINEKLGNLGADKPLQVVRTDAQGLGDIAALTADLSSGAVETLLLFTPSNPVYDAPADLAFAEALAKAKTSIHFGLRTDATAHQCTLHVPASHYLESWGDARSSNGVYTVVQPMILPLYPDCAGELEVLAALLSDDGKLVTGEGEEGAASPALAEVRTTFESFAGEGEEAWKKLLREGFLAGSSYESGTFQADPSAAAAAISSAPKGGELEIIFATDGSIYDGRWIDNGWLQEAPDPISKISWDNVALIAPKTAKELGLYDEIVPLETKTAAIPPDGEGEHRTGNLIKLTINGQTLEIPVQIGFGQAENTVIVSLGYGQGYNGEDVLGRDTANASHVGLVGVNTGFNAYPLRTAATAYFGVLSEKPSATGKDYPIAAVQDHHAMYGRALAREISTATHPKKGTFDRQYQDVARQGNDSHAPPGISFYKQEDRDGNPLLSDTLHQWGMTIDLSSCSGCNACLVACQAENNIPIVGKEQLAKGREMHWIRMDRYFAAEEGREDDPAMIPQPVACVHCESAPCETVCPVNATIHTEDGLNAMAYNRCIGTRYCANNCPYKARRFNFFDYNKRNPLVPHNLNRGPLGEKQVGTSAHLQRNPNVTVRMRGVMEKCTYCVQRLKDSKIRQKGIQKQHSLASGASTGVEVSDGMLRIPVDSVKVACQEACPAEAISFGNLIDEGDSRMARGKKIARNYDLLNYIGTAPRTSYLARVKNPNVNMPDAKFVGIATINMH